MLAAEQAAELLGVEVYDLARLLRRAAADEIESCARRVVRDDGKLNVGRARRLLSAAQACEAAWEELINARLGVPEETGQHTGLGAASGAGGETP